MISISFRLEPSQDGLPQFDTQKMACASLAAAPGLKYMHFEIDVGTADQFDAADRKQRSSWWTVTKAEDGLSRLNMVQPDNVSKIETISDMFLPTPFKVSTISHSLL